MEAPVHALINSLVDLSFVFFFLTSPSFPTMGQGRAKLPLSDLEEKRIFGKQGPSQLSSFVMSEDVARALLDPSHFHYILITPAPQALEDLCKK
jgi:hypothetical protein